MSSFFSMTGVVLKPMAAKKVLWIVPEVREGGIRSYSKTLWPAVREACRGRGLDVAEPIFAGYKDCQKINQQVEATGASIVHFQHEYGLFGGKNPFRYRFPKWVESLHQRLPQVRVLATAHTVLPRDFHYPWTGWGPKDQVRWLGNYTWVPLAKRLWMEKTWGGLDATIVHSKYLRSSVEESGCRNVQEIPHFVMDSLASAVSRNQHPLLNSIPGDKPVVLVFGFFTPDKGQDIAIDAILDPKLNNAILVLAGGVRRPEDQSYFDDCKKKIAQHHLEKRVLISGFLSEDQMDGFFKRSTIVLAPFRTTTGSGSLAQGLSRGAAILASDLQLNQEIAERQPHSLEFFKSGDAQSCAEKLAQLLDHSDRRAELQAAAKTYAQAANPRNIAQQHAELYQSL